MWHVLGSPPRRTVPEHNEAPADVVGGGSLCKRRCACGSVRWCTDGTRSVTPFGGITIGRPSPPSGPWWPGRRCVHHTSLEVLETGRAFASGAAGSRTRVPRSRCSGLYVRRIRMSSDVVLRNQAASTSTPPFDFPLGPAVSAFGVEPRDDDPTLLRGIGGGSSSRGSTPKAL